jgi:hypothetical protein
VYSHGEFEHSPNLPYSKGMDLKGAPAVHFNFPLPSFSLYITFKTGIAAAGEPIPSE